MKNKLKLLSFLIMAALSAVSIAGCTISDPLPGDLYVGGTVGATRLVLNPPVWDNLAISMTNISLPVALAPTDMPYVNSHVKAFDPDAVNVMYFSAQLPHTYLEGSDIEFHIRVVYPDADAGDSVWYFTYSWANPGGTFPGATMTTVISPSTGVADELHEIGILAAINGIGKLIGSELLCSIQRSGALGTDTYANYVYLISCDFHYQVDTLGSRQEGIK